MELDLVDPVAVAVVGVQHRRILVGQPAPLLRLGTARAPAEGAQLVERPPGTLALEPLEQGGVGRRVEGEQVGNLVDDIMRVHRELLAHERKR